MTKALKEQLIKAIEVYNGKQASQEDWLDVHEVMDSLNDFSDETLKNAISEISNK